MIHKPKDRLLPLRTVPSAVMLERMERDRKEALRGRKMETPPPSGAVWSWTTTRVILTKVANITKVVPLTALQTLISVYKIYIYSVDYGTYRL